MLPRFAVWLFSVGTIVLGSGVVSGQDYPNKPIRIVVGGVGGISDFSARAVAQELTTGLGWQVVVINYPSGIIPAQNVSKAPPDGYTLLLAGDPLTLGDLLTKASLPYDLERDFLPVSLTTSAPILVVVHPSLPVKNVKELIALTKARPGAVNYASGVFGSSIHLAAELFRNMAGIKIVDIPFTSGSARMVALISGEVQLEFATVDAAPHVQSGRLRALAVTSAGPSTLAPGVPTVAASGLPGYESVVKVGIFAPANTPSPTINRLSQEIARALSRTDVKEKFFKAGAETVGSSPQEYAAKIKLDREKLTKMIKAGSIRIDSM